ncbi:MAG: glycosyltransferase family 2 protein, partial [Candidatus Heimdallarchaeota archaeon]
MKVLIGIPLYNEQAYLSECISLLFNFLNNECQDYKISVLLVDDGSTDQSQAIYENLAKKFPFRFTRQGNGPLGYGRTILRLFQKAKNSYDTLITFDADLQHAPFSIKEILETLVSRPSVDLVSTSRYLSYRFWKQNTKTPVDRYITNMMVTKTINQCFNLNLTDAFCGLKGYRTIKLSEDIDETGYAFPLAFWYYVYQKELIIHEIETPIIYRLDRRTRGEWKSRIKEYYMKLASLVPLEMKQLVDR